MRAYVIHVSTAHSRKTFITKQLEGKNIEYSFIEDGDIADLTPSIIEQYFEGELTPTSPKTSCAYKHLLAYQQILDGDDDIAMIVEDDLYFYDNYSFMINKIVDEVKRKDINNFIISLEDSTLKYIPRSKRQKGEFLYPERQGRFTGLYLIDKKGITSLLNRLKVEKMYLPVDWFHNICVKDNVIKMYWSEPPISIQGSLNGSIRSLIDNKKFGILRRLLFKLQRFYKISLYNIR